MKSVEFYFDYASPTAYLAYKKLKKICDAEGAEIVYKPVLLGGLFQLSGNNSPASVPSKLKWMWQDLNRYAALYGVTINANPHFPINMIHALRGAIAAQQLGCFDAYNEAVFNGMWQDSLNMGDMNVFSSVLADAGLDVEAIAEKIQDTDVKEQLKTDTAAAAERGLFGVPTFFVNGEMHFGQDRLHFVEQALQSV